MTFMDYLHPNTRKEFEAFYEKKPHLLKAHNKRFETEYDSDYTDVANNFVPDDLEMWYKSLGKLYEYERMNYAKIDYVDNLLIVSYYAIGKWVYLQRRVIFDEYGKSYHFAVKQIGRDTPYAMFRCNGRYQLGGYTDYDLFYKNRQRKLDEKSYQILYEKFSDQLKYVNLGKLPFINPYLLIGNIDNKELIYQIEILIKIGNAKLASDLLLYKRRAIDIKEFKLFKNEILHGMRLNDLEQAVCAVKRKKEEEIERADRKSKSEEFAKMKKEKYDLGKYILVTPRTVKDLEHEGNVLQHCVASYLNSILIGKTNVMFLREKEHPEVPFFTVEINDHKVIQVRTLKNATDEKMTKIVKDFVENSI